MQSNLIISLGMVGALSIVRFRTAIKEPKDILFLFWSISTGIILGAMNYGLALIIAIAVSFLMLFLELIPLGKASMLLVVNLNEKGNEEELMEIVKKYARISVIKSRSRKIEGSSNEQKDKDINNYPIILFIVFCFIILFVS